MFTKLRSVCLAAATVGILAVTPENAACGESLDAVEPHRTVVFSPDRPDRCSAFFVTEFSTSITGVKSQDAVDKFLFTDALGMMWNVDRSRAVGISIDAHLTGGAFRFAPTLRVKQWLAGRSSLDLSLGYASTPIDEEGVVGPIVNVRYSPSAWFHVQAGGCSIRNVSSIYYYPDYYVNETTELQLYAGIGLGGVPGVISWGAQAIGFAGLALVFAGAD